MTLEEQISDFIRDAQYRIAELTNEILNEKNFADVSEKQLHRELLISFLWLLFETRYDIYGDAYNFLDWPEKDIIEEIQYLRKLTGMSEVPYVEFTNYSPVILNIGNGNGQSIPAGSPYDLLTYNANSELVSTPPPTFVGVNPAWSITEVFGL